MTKLSSAGLVYLHFGKEILAHLTQLELGDRQLEVLYDKVSNKQPPQGEQQRLSSAISSSERYDELRRSFFFE